MKQNFKIIFPKKCNFEFLINILRAVYYLIRIFKECNE